MTTYSSARCCVADDAMDPTHAWWYKGTEYVWMGYPEALFLQAEAALRGWNGGSIAQAKQLYLDGVKASMEYYQISSSDYQPYIDHLNGLSAFDGTDKEAILEQIITQNGLLYSRMETKDGLKFAVQIIHVIYWLSKVEITLAEKYMIRN